jgi:hypothetical protein
LMGIAALHPSYDLSCPAQSVAGKSLLHTEKSLKSPIGRLGRARLQQTSNDCICPDDKLNTRQ